MDGRKSLVWVCWGHCQIIGLWETMFALTTGNSRGHGWSSPQLCYSVGTIDHILAASPDWYLCPLNAKLVCMLRFLGLPKYGGRWEYLDSIDDSSILFVTVLPCLHMRCLINVMWCFSSLQQIRHTWKIMELIFEWVFLRLHICGVHYFTNTIVISKWLRETVLVWLETSIGSCSDGFYSV
jgi:hypothetical protein